MAELIVKIKMDESSLNTFWKNLMKESKKLGFPQLERKDVIELDEEIMIGEPAHAKVYAKMIAGIQVCATAQQVTEYFHKEG